MFSGFVIYVIQHYVPFVWAIDSIRIIIETPSNKIINAQHKRGEIILIKESSRFGDK